MKEKDCSVILRSERYAPGADNPYSQSVNSSNLCGNLSATSLHLCQSGGMPFSE